MSILISALLLAGIEIRQVIGLTFVITLVNSMIALGSYWRHGNVDAWSGLLVAVPAIGTVAVGNQVAHSVAPQWLTAVMVACLFVVGVRFVLSPGDRAQTDAKSVVRPHPIWLVLMGCVVGFTMGIMGGGGAVFIAIAFMVLFKMETKTAIGTSILVMGWRRFPA